MLRLYFREDVESFPYTNRGNGKKSLDLLLFLYRPFKERGPFRLPPLVDSLSTGPNAHHCSL
jgi:hypothetical protein